ncbi:MAG: hypothetical protein ACYDCO_22065 [Armatimonadota bacterium]
MKRSLLLVGLLFCALLARAASPTVLRVVDLRWIEGQPELETWVGSLQGTINRQDGDEAVFMVRGPEDAAWADALAGAYALKKEVLTPGAFLDLCKPKLTGQVLYDPAQPWTRDLALTAAAIAPGAVIATHTSVGLPVVLDLRKGWTDRRQAVAKAADQFLRAVDPRALVLAPADGHLLADLIASRKLLAVGLSPFDQQDAVLLRRLLTVLPDGGQVIGHPGTDDVEVAAVQGALTRLHENRPLSYLPARDAANLSCFARFPLTRPLAQFREEAPAVEASGTVAFIYNLGATAGHSTQTLDYTQTSLFRLLDDLAANRLPVGVEVPTALLETAPSLYQLILARQRETAAELIAAPGADPARARQMDLSVVSVRGEPGEWPTTAAMQAVAKAGWLGALVQPLTRQDDPLWLGSTSLPAGFPVVLASRVSSVAELRTALSILKGPGQVIYLDPAGVPPAALDSLLPEIARTHTVMTPSQLLRGQRELEAMLAYLQANKLDTFKRRPPTLRVSTPAVPPEIPDDREVRVAVRIDGQAPVLSARIIYLTPDGLDGAADLHPAGPGQWTATLPPMLTGGALKLYARVVESGGFGETITPEATVKVTSLDVDRDGLSDTQEGYRGSDPRNQDTDSDGLPDGLDDRPVVSDRPVPRYLTPLAPPDDAAMLTNAGASRVIGDCREVPVGSSITYLIPVDGVPTNGVSLHLETEGPGFVGFNRLDPVELEVKPDEVVETSLPVPQAQLVGGSLRVILYAGTLPLRVYEVGLTANPDGPYLRPPQFALDYPVAGVPLAVQATAFSPDGVKAVRLRYGEHAGRLDTLELKPVEGGGNVLYAGSMPAQGSGKALIYGLEAEDMQGNVSATPYRVMTVGRTRWHSVALHGGRDLHGTWEPASLWGGLGRISTSGAAQDTHLFLARPGIYQVWVLAQPRVRGLDVSVAEGSALEGKPEVKLSKTLAAGSTDGWYRLGNFTVTGSQRFRVTVRPVGDAGYCAYGAVVLTQDAGFTPPLRYAGIDWFNSITIRGVTPGQTVTGRINVTVQATGNIDQLTVIAHPVRGNLEDKRFEAGENGEYQLDSRDLAPGEYDITATGWRIVDERNGRTADQLISATVRVVVPGR